MTLTRSPGPTQYEVDSPPQGGLEEVKVWTFEMLLRLVSLQQTPRVQSQMWAQVLSAGDAVFQRPAEGLMIFAGADVVGAGRPAGFYGYVGGAWKLVTVT